MFVENAEDEGGSSDRNAPVLRREEPGGGRESSGAGGQRSIEKTRKLSQPRMIAAEVHLSLARDVVQSHRAGRRHLDPVEVPDVRQAQVRPPGPEVLPALGPREDLVRREVRTW